MIISTGIIAYGFMLFLANKYYRNKEEKLNEN